MLRPPSSVPDTATTATASAVSPASLPAWLLAGPAFYLFILPFSHTNALRSLGLGLTLICGLCAWYRLYRQKEKFPQPPLCAVFAFWLLAALVSLPSALDPVRSLEDLKSDFLYSLIAYGAAFIVTTDARAVLFFRRALGASLLLLSLLAIGVYLRYQQWVIGYQNALGEYATTVITVLPFLATAFFPQRIAGALTAGRKERIFLAAACLAAGVATAFTLSRGVWVVIALSIIAFLVFAAVKRAIPRWTLIVGALAILAGTMALAEHAAEERDTELTNLHRREMIYALAWEEFKKRPFTGVGYGREANRAVYRAAFPDEPLRHAHNVVLSWGEQMGVLGIAAILAIFAALAWHFTRFLYRNPDRGPVARKNANGRNIAPSAPPMELICAAGLIFIVAVFLKNMSDMFFANETLILFFGICGIFMGYGAHLPFRAAVCRDSAGHAGRVD